MLDNEVFCAQQPVKAIRGIWQKCRWRPLVENGNGLKLYIFAKAIMMTLCGARFLESNTGNY